MTLVKIDLNIKIKTQHHLKYVLHFLKLIHSFYTKDVSKLFLF